MDDESQTNEMRRNAEEKQRIAIQDTLRTLMKETTRAHTAAIVATLRTTADFSKCPEYLKPGLELAIRLVKEIAK